MKKLIVQGSFAALCLMIITSCSNSQFKGTWQYDGGMYNGKEQKASPEFKMQRTYTSDTYEAFVIEEGQDPELYNSGVYEVQGDSILIISKFSSQPSQNTDVRIGYKYKIEGTKLTTNGVLPNGMVVEEYWKKVK